MCYFITATLSQKIKLDNLQAILDRYDLAFAPLENPHVVAQLPPSTRYFLTTKGHCDCATVLGYASTGYIRDAVLQSKKYRTVKNKRWSDAKLHLWVDEKVKKEIAKKAKHGRTYSPLELETHTSRWMNFLQDILHTKSIARIGLLKHWYKGNVQTEKITLKNTQPVKIHELTTKYLTHLEDDVLYQFSI
jgi:hypothetical protein